MKHDSCHKAHTALHSKSREKSVAALFEYLLIGWEEQLKVCTKNGPLFKDICSALYSITDVTDISLIVTNHCDKNLDDGSCLQEIFSTALNLLINCSALVFSSLSNMGTTMTFKKWHHLATILYNAPFRCLTKICHPQSHRFLTLWVITRHFLYFSFFFVTSSNHQTQVDH